MHTHCIAFIGIGRPQMPAAASRSIVQESEGPRCPLPLAAALYRKSLASQVTESPARRRLRKHLILVGADVDLFDGAAFPNDYRLIQAATA